MPTSTRSAETAGPPDAWVLLFARVAVAPLFLYSGVGKVLAFAVTAGRLPGGADGLGAVLAAGAIAVELGGGMALLLGLLSRQAAAVLFPFTVAATLMFHNFWAVPEAQVVMQTINFLKNLGLLGALVLIAFYGPGAYAIQTAIKAGPKGAPGLS
ncbi:putative oxidoreductase [Bradyrhizobium japonicum USDA 38]|uniref:DoxX family protein n=1 Tax=Bradyrhizobium japonicum TaxID=375 RepID=UPI00042192CE|nr:DoxX family protein [Bradyrhizobium japonicum]MCS3898213.1 putative oxidoreductase [Bradyrhizobium japonicum USDA 38]MCS3941266.1 putative oxidoreductase [Bradyrhizobium japonicum]MCW2216680.1 putative oxidoreductase [Bradyrhizobium japonicum]MCW2341296.1 putative oxidoreductase [Bradyrhizobium japonicum]